MKLQSVNIYFFIIIHITGILFTIIFDSKGIAKCVQTVPHDTEANLWQRDNPFASLGPIHTGAIRERLVVPAGVQSNYRSSSLRAFAFLVPIRNTIT